MKNVSLSPLAVTLALAAGLALTATAASLNAGDPAPKLHTGKFVQGDPVTEFAPGKAYIVEFWATWCGPCREALPHLRDVAQKFQDQPFVVLSVSLDSDDAKWKDFVNKNNMTWLQYRDGKWTGPIATQFDVKAIPATFSIDTDGVLEDQHVGDADIERKLKKMIAHAVEEQNSKPAAPPAQLGSGGN